MSLKDYVSAIEALIAETPFVTATSLSYEERPPTAGLIKGSVLFTDGSRLDLKEFLIIHPALRVIKYAQRENQLIFRYDNANDPAARNLPTFPSHKHIASGILVAEKPSFEQLLQEILLQLRFP
jgi:hypothetical protein